MCVRESTPADNARAAQPPLTPLLTLLLATQVPVAQSMHFFIPLRGLFPQILPSPFIFPLHNLIGSLIHTSVHTHQFHDAESYVYFVLSLALHREHLKHIE